MRIPFNAHVEPWVTLGLNCVVHPFAVVGKFPSQSPSLARRAPCIRELTIGANTEVGPHSTIYGGSRIGAACLIGDGASVREGAVIGDRCIIGTNVCISYDAVLADDVRVQNGTLIADGWKIGARTFVGVNVSTMSDRHPRNYEFTGSHPTTIGEDCLIGSGSVIMGGLTIGNRVTIAAGALVTKDVPDGATVLGQPARIIQEAPYRLTIPWDRHTWHPQVSPDYCGYGVPDRWRPLTRLKLVEMLVSAEGFMGGVAPLRWFIPREAAIELATDEDPGGLMMLTKKIQDGDYRSLDIPVLVS